MRSTQHGFSAILNNMFDFFKRGDPRLKQIEKTVKRLTEPSGEDGPRIEAAERLTDWGTPEALYGLLMRFTISSKVITQDAEEKRMVVDRAGRA